MNYFYLLILVAIYFCFSHDSKKVRADLEKTRRDFDALAKETGNLKRSPYYVEPEIKNEIIAMVSMGHESRAVKALKKIKRLETAEAEMIVNSFKSSEIKEDQQ